MKSQKASDRRGVPGRKGFWVVLGLLGATGLYWQARPDTQPGSGRPAANIRTARVRTGDLERTLRLTGVIAPERFASLLAPQLQGTRGGPRAGGGGGGGGGSSSSSSSSGGSSSGSSTAGSSSSGASSGSTPAAAGAQSSGAAAEAAAGGAAATAGAGANMSSASGTAALRGALSRFGTSSRSSSQTSGSRSPAATGSSGSGLGSTAGSLGRGGGLGSSTGGGDFNLVLQTAVEPGSHVRKGQIVAEFDRLNMLTRLDDFKVSLTEQLNSLKTLETNLEVARKAHQQSISSAKAALEKAELDLKTIPVQSDIQAEHLRLAAEEARARFRQLSNEIKFKEASQAAELKIARLDYEESRVQLQRIEANAERMLLRAPMDGVVVMGTTFRGSEFSQIRPGDEVRPGMMVMRVVDPGSMIVSATVNQVDIESVRIGMRARVRVDAYPDLELPARVYSIGAMPKSGGMRAAFVKEIPVILKLDRMDPRVIPDLSVSVDLVVEQAPASTIAPLESVFRDPAGRPFVYVQGSSGWERRDVELGASSNLAVVVRSGLRPGEVVAAEWPIQEKRK